MGLGIQHGRIPKEGTPFQVSAGFQPLQIATSNPCSRPVRLPQTFLSTLWRWFGFGQGPSLRGWGKRRSEIVLGRVGQRQDWIYKIQRIHGNGIFAYIYHKNQLNVGKYTIHGSYGKDLGLASDLPAFQWFPLRFPKDVLIETWKHSSKSLPIMKGRKYSQLLFLLPSAKTSSKWWIVMVILISIAH